MPSSPPAPPSLTQDAVQWVVLLGPDDGSAPTLDDEITDLMPLSVSISSTGRRDDVLHFAFLKMPRLVDTTTPIGMKRQIELRALDADGEPTIVVGWGMMARQPQQIDDRSEIVSIEARIGDEHFGDRLTSYPVYNNITDVYLHPQRHLVFNPVVDEVVRFNMSTKGYDVLGGSGVTENVRTVIEWDSVWTPPAQALADPTPPNTGVDGPVIEWKLAYVIHSLCWWLNSDETYIQNPLLSDLLQDSLFDSAPKIIHVEIPFGSSLPEALDAVLLPRHISWCLNHSLVDDVRVTTIDFFSRGDGPVKKILMQRPADVGSQTIRDVSKTNVLAWNATYSVIDLANRIECYGDFEKRESTWELVKGWDKALDTTNLKSFSVGTALYNSNPELGRMWVLNEAGDYIGLRPEITKPFNFSPAGKPKFFTTDQTTRRRRFHKCLSQHGDAEGDDESNGYRVDYWNPYKAGAVTGDNPADPGWERIKWPFSILEKQCGVLFDGTDAPEMLWRLVKSGTPERARVRITATIEGDKRVQGIATRSDKSVNGVDMTLVLEMPHKFQDSRVDSRSIYTGFHTEARNDTATILAYAQEVQTLEDVMRLDCSVTLEGALHPELSIGDTIPKVTGRNLSMKLNDAGRAPQIVGFNIDCQNQRVELLLESYRKEMPTTTQVIQATAGRARKNPAVGVPGPGLMGPPAKQGDPAGGFMVP